MLLTLQAVDCEVEWPGKLEESLARIDAGMSRQAAQRHARDASFGREYSESHTDDASISLVWVWIYVICCSTVCKVAYLISLQYIKIGVHPALLFTKIYITKPIHIIEQKSIHSLYPQPYLCPTYKRYWLSLVLCAQISHFQQHARSTETLAV